MSRLSRSKYLWSSPLPHDGGWNFFPRKIDKTMFLNIGHFNLVSYSWKLDGTHICAMIEKQQEMKINQVTTYNPRINIVVKYLTLWKHWYRRVEYLRSLGIILLVRKCPPLTLSSHTLGQVLRQVTVLDGQRKMYTNKKWAKGVQAENHISGGLCRFSQ